MIFIFLYMYILYVLYFFIFIEDLRNFIYRDVSSWVVIIVSDSNIYLGVEEVSLDFNRCFEFWINNFKFFYMYEKKFMNVYFIFIFLYLLRKVLNLLDYVR